MKQLRAGRDRPRVVPESPYFGHLRLREQNREWDICLGKATFIAGGVSVVDWRNAPVSRLFYRYEQGDEYDEEIAGRARAGKVAVRRTVTVRDGALQRVDAPEGTFRRATDGSWEEAARAAPRLQGGEGTALRVYQVDGGGDRALGAAPDGAAVRADKHLPDIAGLIDPDQFELITKPSSGLVVVRGTAGSGKTTVALHRIAYLAYADSEIDSERTLVVVFSRALRDYVSHVLPALGIQRARVSTFHDWAREQRRRHFPMLPRETRDDAPAVVQRLKAHPVMLEILADPGRSGTRPRRAPGRRSTTGVARSATPHCWPRSSSARRPARSAARSSSAPRPGAAGGTATSSRISPARIRIRWRSRRRTTPCCCAPISSASADSATAAGRWSSVTSRSTRCRISLRWKCGC